MLRLLLGLSSWSAAAPLGRGKMRRQLLRLGINTASPLANVRL
jgi:hypothetical protein